MTDVLVIGGGLVGLAAARAAAHAGARVTVLHASRPGEASRVGAGMLAPSVERAAGAAQAFAVAARDAYPAWVAALAEETGLPIPLARGGVLEVATDEADADTRRAHLRGDSRWLTSEDVLAMDPGFAAPHGAVLHPLDGAVDPVPLMAALERASAASPRITRIAGTAVALTPSGARLDDGRVLSADAVVVAAGAWSGLLAVGARAVPVSPLRGQMLDLRSSAVRHVAYGAGGYVVPRPHGVTYVGATMEDVGFDAGTTEGGRRQLLAVAAGLSPGMERAPVLRHAAALRPMTPDHQPIIGPDPAVPGRWYACGHSRNGILLGPLTGEVVGAGVLGVSPSHDLTPFTVLRFA